MLELRDEFNRLADILRVAFFRVGEIEEKAPPRLPFEKIDELLATLELATFPTELLWIAKSTDLEPVTIYEPGSILVQDRDHFVPLENVVPSLVAMGRHNHRPLAIASSNQLPNLILALDDRGLGFGRLQALSEPEQRRPKM